MNYKFNNQHYLVGNGAPQLGNIIHAYNTFVYVYYDALFRQHANWCQTHMLHEDINDIGQKLLAIANNPPVPFPVDMWALNESIKPCVIYKHMVGYHKAMVVHNEFGEQSPRNNLNYIMEALEHESMQELCRKELRAAGAKGSGFNLAYGD